LSITWVKTAAPPFNMPTQSERLGVCDLLVDEIIARTPHLNHEIRVFPQARINKYFERGDNLCYPCMIKKPSNNLFLYSTATTIYPPYEVITTTENQAKLQGKHGNPMSLPSLFADTSLSYGQSVARRYSSTIQSLQKHIQGRQDVTLNYRADDQAAALGDMLTNQRVDYGIDYPFIADFYNQTHGQELLATTAVQNQHNEIIIGAVGCAAKAPDDFAQTVLDIINPIIRKDILPSDKYQNHQRQWLGKYFKNFNQSYSDQLLEQR